MEQHSPHVIIVSGLSGGGKSTALNALEDLGYYCIDNLPAGLLDPFLEQIRQHPLLYDRVALGIDARAGGDGLGQIPRWMEQLKSEAVECELLFLKANRRTLVKRFSETRRRHPLATDEQGLSAAIDRELEILKPLETTADWVLDTTETNIHQLRRQVLKCVAPDQEGMTIVLESFAFKRGVPQDVDFIFDARNLPNPHWQKHLRALTGRDPRVREWLEQDSMVEEMIGDILAFLRRWLPSYQEAQRAYLTVGIGCTGGKHRSVHVVESLAETLRSEFPKVMIHHREIEP